MSAFFLQITKNGVAAGNHFVRELFLYERFRFLLFTILLLRERQMYAKILKY